MYLIGNTFTQLKPVIQFDRTSIQKDSSTVCILGDPPAQLAGIHSPGLINAWHAKLLQCLSKPVQTEQRKGHRRVHVLGTAIFDFSADGSLQLFIWDFDENDLITLTELPEHAVAVQGNPYQSIWMARYKLGALRALQQVHPGLQALCQAYVDWAHAELVTRCWTQEVQDAVRYHVAVELDCDADMLEVSSQIQLSAQPRLPLRADVYNNAIRHRADYLKLLVEAPQLIPLYALLAEELGYFDARKQEEVTARMRNLLLCKSLTPATWRLICREGLAWMAEHLAYFDFGERTSGSIATDLLVMAQAFGTARWVPPWLLQAILQIGGNPNHPNVDYPARLDDLFPLCARLGHVMAKADETTLALLKERANDIFDWASRNLAQVPKRTLRRANVQWLVRQVDLEAMKKSLKHQGAKPWHVPYRLDLQKHGLSAVVLDSPMAVWQEGQTMHHCADKLIDVCARGRLLMVSLRSEQHPHPEATVAYDMTGDQVQLKFISGLANRLVKPEIRSLAEACCRQLQEQRHGRRVKADLAKSMRLAA